jgi:hypothetical protein
LHLFRTSDYELFQPSVELAKVYQVIRYFSLSKISQAKEEENLSAYIWPCPRSAGSVLLGPPVYLRLQKEPPSPVG